MVRGWCGRGGIRVVFRALGHFRICRHRRSVFRLRRGLSGNADKRDIRHRKSLQNIPLRTEEEGEGRSRLVNIFLALCSAGVIDFIGGMRFGQSLLYSGYGGVELAGVIDGAYIVMFWVSLVSFIRTKKN